MLNGLLDTVSVGNVGITYLRAAVGFATAIFVGYLLMRGLGTRLPRHASGWLLACLSICVGLCVTSLGTLIWRIWFWSIPGSLIVVDFILVAMFAIVFGWRIRKEGISRGTDRPADDPDPPRIFFLLFAVFLGWGIACSITGVVLSSLEDPLGDWDAWAFWNLKAKFLYLGGATWTDMFEPPLEHTDYPLHLPLAIARLWFYQGAESAFIPQSLCVLWVILIPGLLVSSVAATRGRMPALLAGLVLVATPGFLILSARQFADAPLSMYILASFCLLTLSTLDSRHAGPLLVLSGLTAGSAAFTKNEGLLFALALLVATCLFCWPKRGFRASCRVGAALLLGMIPMLITVLIMKLGFAGRTDLFESQSLARMLTNLCDIERHREVISWTIRSFLFPNQIDGPLLLFILVYALTVGFSRSHCGQWVKGAIAGTLLLVAAGYYLVFLITPHDLSWHLVLSHNRLMMHIWPSVLFLIFTSLNFRPASKACDRVPYVRRTGR